MSLCRTNLQRSPEPLLLEKGMNCVVYNKLVMLKKRETLLWMLLEGKVAIVNIRRKPDLSCLSEMFYQWQPFISHLELGCYLKLKMLS